MQTNGTGTQQTGTPHTGLAGEIWVVKGAVATTAIMQNPRISLKTEQDVRQ